MSTDSGRSQLASDIQQAYGRWFNPRTGEWVDAKSMEAKESLTLTPPGTPGRGNDWVAVLDAMSR